MIMIDSCGSVHIMKQEAYVQHVDDFHEIEVREWNHQEADTLMILEARYAAGVLIYSGGVSWLVNILS